MILDDMVSTAKQLALSAMMQENLASMDVETLTKMRIVLKRVQDDLNARLDAVRTVLLRKAEEFGATTERGGSLLILDSGKVFRERRESNSPNESLLEDLLESKGVDKKDAFTKKISFVPDPSKIQNLVDLGILTDDEVAATKKVSWALRVKESESLASVLDACLNSDKHGNSDTPEINESLKLLLGA